MPTTTGMAMKMMDTHSITYPDQVGRDPDFVRLPISKFPVPRPNVVKTPNRHIHNPGHPHNKTAASVPMIAPVFDFLGSMIFSFFDVISSLVYNHLYLKSRGRLG
jgi:hypothetical protein